METTRNLWEILKKGDYETVVSELVFKELGICAEPKRFKLFSSLNNLKFQNVEIDSEMEGLAAKYVSEGIIPSKYESDALHLAAATVSRCNIILSWNYKHIVNMKAIFGINGVNNMLAYDSLVILTPESIIYYKED